MPRGAGSYFVLFLEATPGTANTTPADARPFRMRPGGALVETIEEIESEDFADDVQGFTSDTYQGLRTVEGSYTTSALYESMGTLWHATLGASSTTADTPSVGLHTHLYEPADDLPAYTVIESTGSAWQETFTGCKVNRLVLSVAPGRRLSAEVSFIGMSSIGRTTSLTAHTLPAAAKVEAKHLSAQVSWNGNDHCAESLTLTVENNLETVYCIESDTPDEAEQGDAPRKVTIACESRLQNLTLYNAHQAQTTADLDLDFVSGDNHLKVHLDDARIVSYEEQKDRNGKLRVRWTWQGVAAGADKGITLTAINTQTTATEA